MAPFLCLNLGCLPIQGLVRLSGVVSLAPMGAPSGHPEAFKSASRPGRALAVLEGGALSDLDNITVRIANIAARLAVLGDRLGDELGSSTFP